MALPLGSREAGQQDLAIQEWADPDNNPMIPHTLVLAPCLVIYKIYNGYWFWGRPLFYGLWHGLRDPSREIRPDRDLETPGLREPWEADGLSAFHGWDRWDAGKPITAGKPPSAGPLPDGRG